jgi:ubiquinone biosynthesis monooxygenase Coq6
VESRDLGQTRSWRLPETEYSNRCSSLTPTSVKFLEGIGVWKHIQRERVQPYVKMQVWDGITGSRIEFDWAQTSHGNTIAYMTENLNLTSALLKRIDELDGIDVFDSTMVEGIDLGHETESMDLGLWPILRLSGGRQLAARLLVGADGANSPVRTFSGIETSGWDYEQHGLVATLGLEASSGDISEVKTAYQRFLPTGPAALLPLPGKLSTLVWSTTPSQAAHLKTLSSTDFIAMVNAAFRLSPVDIAYLHTLSSGQADEVAWRYQHTPFDVQHIPQPVHFVQEGSIASFPLKMLHADTYIGERVALVGDAAHNIHPLAGQGLNQGQGDVESLVGTIKYAVAHGQDIGARSSLGPYNADRYVKNHLLLGVVDKLHKLYSFKSGPLIPVRSVGLKAVNAFWPLKQLIMSQAAGTKLI